MIRFDWGSEAIEAGGCCGLAAITVAAMLGVMCGETWSYVGLL